MLKIYYKKSIESEVQELEEVTKGCLVHADEASTSDLEIVSNLTNIEYTDLLDCLDKYEIARVEQIEGNLLIYTRYPTDQEVGHYTSTLTLILTDDYLIAITPHRSNLIKSFLEQNGKYSTTSNTELIISIIEKIAQEFTIKIRKVRYNILSAEREMISVDSEDITAITKSEEILNQYLSNLTTTKAALKNLTSGIYPNFHEEEQALLGDCIISIKQSEELCINVIKSIRSLRESYQIIFTNNLHKTIKLLTALTIILSIPTMIASIYGMNVALPFAKNAFAFGIVIGGTMLLTACGFWLFRKRGWL